jgi:hypothetical protein
LAYAIITSKHSSYLYGILFKQTKELKTLKMRIPERRANELQAYPRRGLSAASAVVILVVILVLAASAFIYFPPQQALKFPTSTQTTASVPSGNVAGKIQFNLQDILSGAAVGSATMKIYPAAGSVVGGVTYGGATSSEAPTVSSAGIATTNLMYAPGTVLNIYLSATNYALQYAQVVAPGVTPAMQAQGTPASLTIYMVSTPTITLSLTDDKGNVYTSNGNKINFTKSGTCTSGNNCLGESTISLTLTVSNTASNTGFMSSYDPINKQSWCAAIQVKEGGTYTNVIGVSGFPSTYGAFTVGSTRYWQTTVPDGINPASTSGTVISPNAFVSSATDCAASSVASGSLSRQTTGTTSQGGSVSLTFQIKQNSLSHGQTLTLTVLTYLYYDPVYAAQNSGTGGATAVPLGSSFIINIAA